MNNHLIENIIKPELIPLAQSLQKIGNEIHPQSQQGIGFEYKQDRSKVTEADYFADRAIRKTLQAISSSPIVSEEYGGDLSKIANSWLIDPIDGTSDFINKTGDYSLMVSYLKDFEPILCLIFAPARQTFYYSYKGQGAFFASRESCQRIHVNKSAALADYRLVVSRNHGSKRELAYLESLGIDTSKPKTMGSIGLKAGCVAHGKAEVYFNSSSKLGLWDVAPCDILIREAGGVVTDKTGAKLNYNCQSLKMPLGCCFSASFLEHPSAHGASGNP